MAELRRTGPAPPPGLPGVAQLAPERSLRRRSELPRGAEQVRAWRPAVPGILEVFHARFVTHAYPPHAHDAWPLLIVDAGASTTLWTAASTAATPPP